MERLVEVGRRHGVAVIEVAACAIGSETLWNGEWQKIGKPHGDVSCFSFHPLKLVSTGDGGMLTTQNPEWDAQFRLLPHSEQAQDRCILLPLYPSMREDEQQAVASALRRTSER